MMRVWCECPEIFAINGNIVLELVSLIGSKWIVCGELGNIMKNKNLREDYYDYMIPIMIQ